MMYLVQQIKGPSQQNQRKTQSDQIQLLVEESQQIISKPKAQEIKINLNLDLDQTHFLICPFTQIQILIQVLPLNLVRNQISYLPPKGKHQTMTQKSDFDQNLIL